MRIDKIEVFHVMMPMLKPWRTAFGEYSSTGTVLVKMHSGSDIAWGEGTPEDSPTYSPEYSGGVFAVIKDWLAPAILGRDITSGEQLQEILAPFKGNYFAKAALDTAWWAMHSLQTKTPVYKLLGATRNMAPAGDGFGAADTIDDLIKEIQETVDQGCTRVKLKFKPGWDIPVVAAVRKKFPKLTLHIDCNSAFTLADLPMFKELDRYGLSMFEQPLYFEDVIDHARLAKQVKTPVCLDESITTLHHARQAIELKACLYANIKCGHVGGLTFAKKLHDMFQQAGVPCWVGGMGESPIGMHMIVALSMLDNFSYTGDMTPTSKFFGQSLCDPPVVWVRDSRGVACMQASDKPGNPSLPNEKLLKAWTVEKATVGK